MATLDLPTREDLMRVEAKLDMLLAQICREAKTITVSQIASELGMAESTLRYSHPWLLPNFGVSQYPGVKRWDMKVYESWKSEKTPDERKAEFLAHATAEAKRHYIKRK